MRYHTLHIILASTLIAAVATAAPAKAKPGWPKGIDPGSLLENSDPEPDLSDPGFVDLFNGKDLSGWSVKGGAMQFAVRNGAVVGTCVPGQPNGFLCTDRVFRDFVFTTEFKWEVKGNSGIMFRSGLRPEQRGERVFGYQSEMDVAERGWTGGIYGEAMGGWKYPLSKPEGHAQARAAIQDHADWNRMTIMAEGNVIKTWINGVPCAHLVNDERNEGVFGLQVHGGKQGTILWRNIRIRELCGEEGFVDLFSTEDFSSWSAVNGNPVGEGWSIKDGVVHRGGQKPGDIVTRDQFKNFDLRFEFRVSQGGNSGVKYRSHNRYGPEYQVLDDERHPNGKDPEKCVASLYDIKAADGDKPSKPAMEWNTGRILAVDSRLQHWLNDRLVLELDQDSEEWMRLLADSKYRKTPDFGTKPGQILLQDHNDPVWYRNVRIKGTP